MWNNPSERASLDQLAGEGVEILAAPFSRGRAFTNCMTAIPRPLPLQSVYSWEPALAQRVVRALTAEPFDVLHVEHLRGAQYGLWIRDALFRRDQAVPIVWDSVDCISYLFEQAARYSKSGFGRMASLLELDRTRRYEPWLVEQFDRTLVTSEQDKRALIELGKDGGPGGAGFEAKDDASPRMDHAPRLTPHALYDMDDRIRTLPNGVDLDYFRPVPIERERDTLILSGKMSYHANVTAAQYLIDQIMPQVWRELPGVSVKIVGSHPTREVMLLAARHAGRVSVTGHVPDLRSHLARATMAVAPIVYGAGIQNKVLEAMAMGTPVVASPQAVSALAVHDGENVLVGADATQFAAHVVRLFRDPPARERLGDRGREYVETEHDWQRVAERLEDVYRELAPAREMVQGGMPVL